MGLIIYMGTVVLTSINSMVIRFYWMVTDYSKLCVDIKNLLL